MKRPLLPRLKAWAVSPAGRRVEVAVIAYVVTELERRGYLPAVPIPKP